MQKRENEEIQYYQGIEYPVYNFCIEAVHVLRQ